jgi:hypothetical protein
MQRLASLLAVVGLLQGWNAFGAQSRSTAITVVVRPAATLILEGVRSVTVKIRLAPDSHAKIWRSDNCDASLPVNSHVISTSGVLSVPLEAIEGGGSKICLASSDGTLVRTLSLY